MFSIDFTDNRWTVLWHGSEVRFGALKAVKDSLKRYNIQPKFEYIIQPKKLTRSLLKLIFTNEKTIITIQFKKVCFLSWSRNYFAQSLGQESSSSIMKYNQSWTENNNSKYVDFLYLYQFL